MPGVPWLAVERTSRRRSDRLPGPAHRQLRLRIYRQDVGQRAARFRGGNLRGGRNPRTSTVVHPSRFLKPTTILPQNARIRVESVDRLTGRHVPFSDTRAVLTLCAADGTHRSAAQMLALRAERQSGTKRRGKGPQGNAGVSGRLPECATFSGRMHRQQRKDFRAK